MTRILFLAAHIQPFLSSGIHALLSTYNVSVMVICYAKDPIAPLDLKPRHNLTVITLHEQPDMEISSRIKAFHPDITFCAGWMERTYLHWCIQLRQQGSITICAFDTQWKGTLKQRLLALLSPYTLHRCFTHAWVPGKLQYTYAKRLGFKEQNILHHLYAPDTEAFSKAYEQFIANKPSSFPKQFIYTGRMVPHKCEALLQAFHSLSNQELAGWTLLMIGNGPIVNTPLMKHDAIIHLPFTTQQDLIETAAKGGVFCLCSSYEPWGTVVQEFASAGMPLVVSHQCGSQTHFLTNGSNGFVCDGKSPKSIAQALRKIIHSDDKTLFEMGVCSHKAGIVSNSHTWAATLFNVGHSHS